MAMVKIIAAIALGYFLYKIHILNDEANAVISKLIIYGCGVCMIFSSVSGLDASNKGVVLVLILGGIGVYVLLAVLAFIVARFLSPSSPLRGIYEVIMVFGNTAFLGFPIGEAFMGSIGFSYMAILNIHNNVFAYSYGVYLLTKGGEGKFKFSFKKLLNPGIISALLGLAFFFIGIKVPDIVMAPIDFVGQLTSPLAMIVMGSSMATYSFKNLFNNWRYYILSVFKLIVFPLAVFFIARAAISDQQVIYSLTLHAAMPPATIVSMLAMANGADYKTTTSATGLMNLLCIATIPAIWMLITAL